MLVVLAISLWAASAALRAMPRDRQEVSIAQLEERSIGVIAGGASIAAGIILLATAV
jgi:hypothetical protein